MENPEYFKVGRLYVNVHTDRVACITDVYMMWLKSYATGFYLDTPDEELDFHIIDNWWKIEKDTTNW